MIPDVLRGVTHRTKSIIILTLLVQRESRAAVVSRWQITVLDSIVIVFQQTQRVLSRLMRESRRLDTIQVAGTMVARGLLLNTARYVVSSPHKVG
jgi:hypothetical protein